MLIEKSITMNSKKRVVNMSKYVCDMCKKELKKTERILVGTSKIGEDKTVKKYDLCENCMKIIEKNIKIWYDRNINKK